MGGGNNYLSPLKTALKRGFTIMELVIVIAVIAVLAAVLIPTFANVIDRANQSSDIQAVRNMNTSISAADADGSVDSLNDVKEALAADGMNIDSYTALAENHKFVWDSELNRILYVNSETNAVEYPEEYSNLDYGEVGSRWIDLATGEMATDDSWQSNDETVSSYTLPNEVEVSDSYTKYELSSAAQLMSFSDYVNGLENEGADIIVELSCDIDLLGAEWIPVDEFAGIFNGNGYTISNLTITDPELECNTEFISTTSENTYRPYGFISVFTGDYLGNVVFEDVHIDAPGAVSSSNHTVAAVAGAVVNNEENTTIYIHDIEVSGVVTSAYRVAGIVGFVGGTPKTIMAGNVTISDCVNNADITSTLCAATYNTAAGILSTSNQLAETATVTIQNNTNNGGIYGQISGGIVGATFGAGALEKGSTTEYSAGSKGTMIITGNTNNGDVTAHHIDGYTANSTTPDGEYVYTVETSARAAGIISAQTHQERVYVYENTNTGTIVATNEAANGQALEYESAPECTKGSTDLGYILSAPDGQ